MAVLHRFYYIGFGMLAAHLTLFMPDNFNVFIVVDFFHFFEKFIRDNYSYHSVKRFGSGSLIFIQL